MSAADTKGVETVASPTTHARASVLRGDICDLAQQMHPAVIVQQCNCKTLRPKGLALALAKRFPYCNIYSTQQDAKHPRVPGMCKICKPEKSNANTDVDTKQTDPIIINLLAQKYPGSASAYETYDQRLRWLETSWKDACQFFETLEVPTNILIPKRLGCGLAGGPTERYEMFWRTHLSLVPSAHRVFFVEFDE